MSNSMNEILMDQNRTTDEMTYGFFIGDILYSSMKILME
jgi:hypothetical protein